MPRCGVLIAIRCILQGAESGVRVNSIAPGHVQTPTYGDMPYEGLVEITKTTQLIGRPTQPEEVRSTWYIFQGCVW